MFPVQRGNAKLGCSYTQPRWTFDHVQFFRSHKTCCKLCLYLCRGKRRRGKAQSPVSTSRGHLYRRRTGTSPVNSMDRGAELDQIRSLSVLCTDEGSLLRFTIRWSACRSRRNRKQTCFCTRPIRSMETLQEVLMQSRTHGDGSTASPHVKTSRTWGRGGRRTSSRPDSCVSPCFSHRGRSRSTQTDGRVGEEVSRKRKTWTCSQEPAHQNQPPEHFPASRKLGLEQETEPDEGLGDWDVKQYHQKPEGGSVWFDNPPAVRLGGALWWMLYYTTTKVT